MQHSILEGILAEDNYKVGESNLDKYCLNFNQLD